MMNYLETMVCTPVYMVCGRRTSHRFQWGGSWGIMDVGVDMGEIYVMKNRKFIGETLGGD